MVVSTVRAINSSFFFSLNILKSQAILYTVNTQHMCVMLVLNVSVSDLKG